MLLLLSLALQSAPSVWIRPSVDRSAPCLAPDVVRDAEILAIGTYQATLTPAFTADTSGHPAKIVAVAAAPRGRPLVLLLGAYEPVVWDLRGVPRQRLRAVVVTGYHIQGVAGANRVPVRFATLDRSDAGCGGFRVPYKGGKELDALDAKVEQTFGRPIDRFVGDYSLGAVSIDAGARMLDPATVRLDDVQASGRFETGALGIGAAGIARLVASGAIRPAFKADIAELDDVLTSRSRSGRLAPVRSNLVGSTFVALRPFVVPPGMYGANSATFLIPAGVAMPVDRGSHNSYRWLDTGECRGPMCRL